MKMFLIDNEFLLRLGFFMGIFMCMAFWEMPALCRMRMKVPVHSEIWASRTRQKDGCLAWVLSI